MSIDILPVIDLILKSNASFRVWVVHGNESEYQTVRVTVEVYEESIWFNVPIRVGTNPKLNQKRTMTGNLHPSTPIHP